MGLDKWEMRDGSEVDRHIFLIFPFYTISRLEFLPMAITENLCGSRNLPKSPAISHHGLLRVVPVLTHHTALLGFFLLLHS